MNLVFPFSYTISFPLKLNSELWIFMELMNMSMKQFYVRMHLMTVINPNNIDFLLRRIIHNVRRMP